MIILNFLAHLYLSENNTNIMIGNFIADHIKGNRFSHLNSEIQKGIRLHREIDTFTDSHVITKKSKRRLHKRYGLYAGIIIDIFYDHYLAKNWKSYSEIPLDVYVEFIYELLEKNKEILPQKTIEMIPYMVQYNWLYNYQYKDGIERVLNGMNRRTNNNGQLNLAIEDLYQFDQDFEKDFEMFFKDIQTFSHKKIKKLHSINSIS